MFNYFHKNKFNYRKAQALPIFIAVLVVLIIMAMATVNLSKLATDKTYTANAVDAGGLAAGAVMANTFNALATQNQTMYVNYWMFFGTISGMFIIALAELGYALSLATSAQGLIIAAMASACPTPCKALIEAIGAIGMLESANLTLEAFKWQIIFIGLTVTAFQFAQWYHYKLIRDMVDDGRDSAIEMGHRFAFINSGISSRLPEEIPAGSNWNKTRKNLNKFIDGLEHNETYTFDWIDGQARNHEVRTQVQIDEVEKYKLQTTVLPYPAEMAMLTAAYLLADTAIDFFDGALDTYYWLTFPGGQAAGKGIMKKAYKEYLKCLAIHHGPSPATCAKNAIKGAKSAMSKYATIPGALAMGCGVSWIFLVPIIGQLAQAAWCALVPILVIKPLTMALATNHIPGITTVIITFIPTSLAWAGLLPYGIIFTSSSKSDPYPLYIICWIVDVIHNRLVRRVDSWQSHAGADLGFWRMIYPGIHSFSKVNFRGGGSITPPIEEEDLTHDPDIIDTDKIGPGR